MENETTKQLLNLMMLERDRMWARFIRYRRFDDTVPASPAILELRESALGLNDAIKQFCSLHGHDFRDLDTSKFYSENIEQTFKELDIDINDNPMTPHIQNGQRELFEDMVNNMLLYVAVEQCTVEYALKDLRYFAEGWGIDFNEKDFLSKCRSVAREPAKTDTSLCAKS